jgi:hypothetical protein
LDIFEALLYAEARLGELLKPICASPAGRTKVLPEGITKKQSHYAQTLADHPDIIEEVIIEAKTKL